MDGILSCFKEASGTCPKRVVLTESKGRDLMWGGKSTHFTPSMHVSPAENTFSVSEVKICDELRR